MKTLSFKLAICGPEISQEIFARQEIANVNRSTGRNCGGFGKYQACATNSETAKMNKMPIVYSSIFTRILAYW